MTGVTFKLGLREYCVVYYSPWGLGISLMLVASSLQVVHHSENNIDITFLSCGSRMCDFHPLKELCLLNLSVGEGNGTPPQYSCWKIPWTEEPGRVQSMGSEQSDTTERLHFHFSLSCIGEGNGNPLQCSCLENPRDGGAWWAAVYGITQSRTRLKWLSSSNSNLSVSRFKIKDISQYLGISTKTLSV